MLSKSKIKTHPSEPATLVQRLSNVFQTSMTFGTRWVVVVLTTSRIHWDSINFRTPRVHFVNFQSKLLFYYKIHLFTGNVFLPHDIKRNSFVFYQIIFFFENIESTVDSRYLEIEGTH